jgi:hypothetical protein
MKYKICWKSKITGYTGEGEPVLDEAEANQIVEDLNKEWTDLEHWAVGVENA